MSRQQDEPSSSTQPTPKSSTSRSSPLELDRTAARQAVTGSGEPSPSPQSPQVVTSSGSEGYPSWLPKRPPPPAPRSTIHSSSVGMFNEGPSAGGPEPLVGGRKATPRSVRIVSLQNSMQGEKDPYGRREPTDPSRYSGAAHARVWSRATSAGLTPTVFSSSPFQPHLPRPRFRSSSFHPELLRHPSWKMRLWFYLFPVFVFAHIPLQTFFDFNAVFILLSVAKFPNPAAPGVPGSGRNWALGAAAYIACWFTQIFLIFLVYELVYSFIRRWRIKRPLILPIYLSSPAFNCVSMTSYTNFCFMYYIRWSAFVTPAQDSQHERSPGSLRDGLAETFYYYSQNLPTVALLLPRAALSLALLLAYSTSSSSLPAGDAGVFSRRDGTFFRAENGTLTGYARGVLIANAAWSAWRILVLLVSWIGLWVLSGQGCAGLCGPRYRWEEEDRAEVEKTIPPYSFSDNPLDDMDTPLPWTWRENAVLRVCDAWEFCLTNKLPLRSAPALEKKEGTSPGFEGMDRVFAAVGLAGGPHPARRGVLSEDLFASPEPGGKNTAEEKFEDIAPPPPAQTTRERKSTAGPSGPLMKLPYPFTGYGAQVSSSSSEEVVPFPPSPVMDVPITDEDETHDEEDEEENVEEHEEEEEEVEVEESEVPSSERRTSGSMSSLGRPVVSRYPFQLRHPMRGGSVSSASQMIPPTNVSTPRSRHTQSSDPSNSSRSRSTKFSRSTQSTGNRESSDSPMSNAGSSSGASPMSSSFSGSVIPMPPRHPQSQQRRSRAGTVPASLPSPSSPSPVVFPGGRQRARTRTESMATDTSMTFGPIPLPAFDHSDGEDDDQPHHEDLMDVPEAEGSIEEAEQHDSVGLLSAGPSPHTSLVNLRHIGSGLSLHHHHHHRRSAGSRSHSATSRSNSRSRTNSATSRSESARSRAQSLIQSLSAASRSSLELVNRSRASSMARLSDSPYYSTSPDPTPSSPENHTFGHPLREEWRESEERERDDENGEDTVGAAVAAAAKEQDEHDVAEAAAHPLPTSEPSSRSNSGSGVYDTPALSHQQQPSLHLAPSTISHSAPSEAPSEQPSERSTRTERRVSVPIPIPGRSPQHQHSPHEQQYAESLNQHDISTADQSFVTAPATIEGRTDTSGRTPSSWGTSGTGGMGQMQGVPGYLPGQGPTGAWQV